MAVVSYAPMDEMTTGVREFARERFREVLSHAPTGVTIITARTPCGLTGMTANSFTSVSLDPPLVLFCPSKTSETWPRLRDADRFCINILAREHEQLCRQFAQKGADRFAGVPFHGRLCGPALDGAVGWLDCEMETEHEAGDHLIVVARVLEIDANASVSPLVFHRGRYGTV